MVRQKKLWEIGLKKKKNRDKIILATKISGPGLTYVRGGGPQYTEKKISEAIENSLKRLKTDYIDLYQFDWPERKTNFFGKLRIMTLTPSRTEWNITNRFHDSFFLKNPFFLLWPDPDC